jgi:hypothetical protein
MGDRIAAWAALFLLIAVGAAAQSPAGPGHPRRAEGDPRPADPARAAVWTPDPGSWVTLERQAIHGAKGWDWLIESGQRRLGSLTGQRTAVEVDLPRIVIGRVERGETTLVCVLLPDGNRDLILRPPGSGDESAQPSEATEDAYGRWPNPCSFAIHDASGNLDLDGDGTPEIAIRRFCSCASVPCSGIVFIELDPREPRLLDIPSIIGNADLGPVTIRETDGRKDPARPILTIAPDLLDGCRFIAMAGVRGASECDDCCVIPVLAGPVKGGYALFYDPDRQKEQLRQAQKDIGYVAAGAPGPFRSNEEAQIARAASFYYLTGLGSKTRDLLTNELGARGRDPRALELLERLDEIFLGASPGNR